MKKRERILLVLTLLVVLYGGYEYFFRKGAPEKNRAAAEETLARLDGLKSTLVATFAKGALTDEETYILSRASAEWEKDPFLGRKLPENLIAPDPEVRMAEFAYTGYVNTGVKSLAVINGAEYELGEEVVPGGYLVIGITPSEVVLGREGRAEAVTVPFTGEIF